MEMRGRKNSGKPKDIEVLEQLEEVSLLSDLDVTVTISTANLRWLVNKAGMWIRRSDEDGMRTLRQKVENAKVDG